MENTSYKQNSFRQQQQRKSLSLPAVVDLIIRLRYWLICSSVVAIVIGFVIVRMQNPIYERSTYVMLNNDAASVGESLFMSDMMGGGPSRRIENEVFILSSSAMMQRVVEKLDLGTRYFHYTMPIADRIDFGRELFARKLLEYYRDNPFSLDFRVDSLYPTHMHPGSFDLTFKHKDKDTYVVKSLVLGGGRKELEKTEYKYGEKVSLPGCSFSVSIDRPALMEEGEKYRCSWTPSLRIAKLFSSKLVTEVQAPVRSRQSDVIRISLEDTNAARASDILNTLVIEVNDESRAYDNITAINTIDFIDKRLVSLSKDLASAENAYKTYQTSNIVVDLGSQSQASIQLDNQNRERLNDVNLQLQLLDMVSEYITADAPGKFSIIPANIGVTDASLNNIISEYNTLVSDRNRMVSNSSESNPRVLSLNSQLTDLKHSIEISIANLVKIYDIRKNELEKSLQFGKTQLANIPVQQFEMQQLSRRLEVIEPLYLLLQQKREEAHIQMYAQKDNFRVIELAGGSSSPVKPQASKIYLIAFLIGFALPVFLVWMRMQVRTTVETKLDVTDRIKDASVLTVLPHSSLDDGELIKKNSRDSVCESFRNLRTSLQYLKDIKVIQITSSVLREGKTFVAANLALSIAHQGRRVLLIGMDIRKPRLSKVFAAEKLNSNNTVVGYLVGRCTDLDLLVNHTRESHHLDIIYAGPVPPNPTELLSRGGEADIINYFRDKYDYIIVDSAPYMPVSDSFIINEFVDATIYTIRANRTPLALLNEINEVVHGSTKHLKNVYFVLNDMNYAASKYRYGYGYGYGGYGYGYGYGYGGYGYGYGYGYGEEDPVKIWKHRHKILSKIFPKPPAFLFKKDENDKH